MHEIAKTLKIETFSGGPRPRKIIPPRHWFGLDKQLLFSFDRGIRVKKKLSCELSLANYHQLSSSFHHRFHQGQILHN
jgi:hypothetical protein